MVQENLPGSQWRLARIERLIERKNRFCRAAQVKLANGNEIKRLLQLLLPLEVQDPVDEEKEPKESNSTGDHQCFPKRKSAIEARRKIQMWTQ